MSCPRSTCSNPSTFTTEDGTKMETWYSIRREHLRNMRKMVKKVVLYMALMEALRIGPDAIVLAGTKGYPEPGPDDFGIAYYAAYILSYIYLCVFSIVWKPLFSWWVPTITTDSALGQTLDKASGYLYLINLVLLIVSFGFTLGEYGGHLLTTFIFVDARPVDNKQQWPQNNRKNWIARLVLLFGILVTVTAGYGVFAILDEVDLAHVKYMEYMAIVVPVQINLGVFLGSVIQWKMEKRQERKRAVLVAVREVELMSFDEKKTLLDV